jgi:D-alanyl-D-alanine carboxypeptidase
VRPLSWLTPGLGQVDALEPTKVDPPNLRDQMCGKNRRRPPSEEAENDPLAEVSADSPYAVFLSTLRGPNPASAGPLLQDVPLGEPVRVYIGSPSAPIDQAPGEARAGKGKGKTKTATKKKSDESKTSKSGSSKSNAGPALAHSPTSTPVTTDAGRAAPEAKKKTAKKDTKKDAKKDGVPKDAKKEAAAKVSAKPKPAAKKSEPPTAKQ